MVEILAFSIQGVTASAPASCAFVVGEDIVSCGCEVRLGWVGRSVWTTLSSFEGLVVGREVSIRHPFKFLPQEMQECLQFFGDERVLCRERESLMLSNKLPSSTSSANDVNDPLATTGSEDNWYVVDALADVSNAVAMATTSGEAKREQALIVEKVLENVPSSEGEGELLVQQEAGQDKAKMLNERIPLEREANGIAVPSETPLDVKDEQAEMGQEARDKQAKKGQEVTSQDYTHNVQLVPDAQTQLAQRVIEEDNSSSQCKYGYIYVYDLPQEYNRDIIANCTALNVFLNVCDTLLNDGLGNTLGEASSLGQRGSWLISDQFTTEVVFHNRMLEHPCLTDKPEKASGFYVPIGSMYKASDTKREGAL